MQGLKETFAEKQCRKTLEFVDEVQRLFYNVIEYAPFWIQSGGLT